MSKKEDDDVPVSVKEYMDFTKEFYHLHYLLSYFISIDARNMFFNFPSQSMWKSYHDKQIQIEIENLFDFLSSEFKIGDSVKIAISEKPEGDDKALYVAWPILGTDIYLVAMRALSGEMKISLIKDEKKLKEFFSHESIANKLQKVGKTKKAKVIKNALKSISLKGFADKYDYLLKNGFFEF